MDSINNIMSGGNAIINNKNNCLLSPSIKCDDNINYSSYSSKILPNTTIFNDYITDYNNNFIMDKENKYLIKLPKTCDIQQNKINECSKLENINNIKNIITEESYSLQDYINNPKLLNKFIENENNFLKIFLSEFKNLFEALIILDEKNVSHLKINPKNIIFNQKTKKIKFINFGERINKIFLINNYFNENRNYKYDFNIYYPFICFFVNYSNYQNYKHLSKEEDTNFINFLKHTFFDEKYTETNNIRKSRNLIRLKEQFTIIKNNEKFIKYKKHIQNYYSSDKTTFFNGILTYDKNNYIRNTNYKSFLKCTINAVDIYGLSMSLLLFFNIFKNTYSIDPNVYNKLLTCFNDLAINIPSSKIERTCIPKKSFTYFKKRCDEILQYLKKKQPMNINFKKNISDDSQYKLKSSDIIIYNENSDKNYIDYNGKLMRAFNATNIFTHLNNLSSHNYSMIKKNIDKHTGSINRLIILINKEAYYKIKYNLYCSDNEEVNIYTRKCVTRCPKDYQRNFNNRNFKCTRKNIKNKNIKNKNIKNKNINDKNINDKIIKKNKIIEKNKNKKTEKCPLGYERNPFTKTCTRKCPSGYIRNLKFNCISEKDVM